MRVTEQHDIPGDFSPDGSELAFHRPLPNTDASPLQGTLMVVDLDTLDTRQVTPEGVIISCCPSWSPDGSRITFVDPDGSLWLIDPDGENLTEIFDGGDDSGYAIDPDWSPDGTHIMFALNSGPDPFSHPLNEVAIIDADGTDATTVMATEDFKRDLSWVPSSSQTVEQTDTEAPQETQPQGRSLLRGDVTTSALVEPPT
jgi:Tol biopolymer transport system component